MISFEQPSNKFRNGILDQLDSTYDSYDGRTPDHIILSEEMYNHLKNRNKFEQLKDSSNPKRPGYLGMKVWSSSALDQRGKVALCVSDAVFHEIAPKAKDF